MGSWSLDGSGILWISESTTPNNPKSWKFCGVKLDRYRQGTIKHGTHWHGGRVELKLAP